MEEEEDEVKPTETQHSLVHNDDANKATSKTPMTSVDEYRSQSNFSPINFAFIKL